MFDAHGAFDLAALESGIANHLELQGRVLLILNDPCQNPCGYSMTRDEWRGVAELLARHASRGPITLLIDMAYYLYGSAADPRGASRRARAPCSGRSGSCSPGVPRSRSRPTASASARSSRANRMKRSAVR
jgi:hypothetical protein